MSRIIYLIFIAVSTCLNVIAEINVSIDKIGDEKFTYTIHNDTKENVELDVKGNQLVFITLEIWEAENAIALYTKTHSDISGFVSFDAVVIKAGEKKVFTSKFSDFSVNKDNKNHIDFFRRFLKHKRNGYFSLRVCLHRNSEHELTSKLKEVKKRRGVSNSEPIEVSP